MIHLQVFQVPWSWKVYSSLRPSGDGVDGPNWRPISGLLLPPWRFRLRQGPWSILSAFRSVSNEPVELISSDELLDLIPELNALLCIVVVVTMVEAELVRIALPRVCAHPFRPWQLLSDLHQHLDF